VFTVESLTEDICFSYRYCGIDRWSVYRV